MTHCRDPALQIVFVKQAPELIMLHDCETELISGDVELMTTV